MIMNSTIGGWVPSSIFGNMTTVKVGGKGYCVGLLTKKNNCKWIKIGQVRVQ